MVQLVKRSFLPSNSNDNRLLLRHPYSSRSCCCCCADNGGGLLLTPSSNNKKQSRKKTYFSSLVLVVLVLAGVVGWRLNRYFNDYYYDVALDKPLLSLTTTKVVPTTITDDDNNGSSSNVTAEETFRNTAVPEENENNGRVSDDDGHHHHHKNKSTTNVSLKVWRKMIQDKCRNAQRTEDVLNLYRTADQGGGFVMPPPPERTTGNEKENTTNTNEKKENTTKNRMFEMRRCKRTVLDFGSNIGDTLSHIIATNFVQCVRTDLGKKKKKKNLQVVKSANIHFNVETFRFEETFRGLNPVTHYMTKFMEQQQQRESQQQQREQREEQQQQQQQNTTTATTATKDNNGPDSVPPVFEEEEDELGPEDYCYYGIEGNPVFTEQLQHLEQYVTSIQPRPIGHVQFLTESVGAGSDGPTTLYLDTVNRKENYWGTSLFANHQDVRKSAEASASFGPNSTAADHAVSANVTGYTLGTLLRQIMVAFTPPPPPPPSASSDPSNPSDPSPSRSQSHDNNTDNSDNNNNNNNHLVLKIDIEGGEYPLLDEAIKDGTLCEFVSRGNQVDVLVEFHSRRVIGHHNYPNGKYLQKTLQQCNVTFHNLQAWWA